MVHIRTILYFHCRHAQALAGKYSTDFHHVIYHIFQHTHTKTHTPRHTHTHTQTHTRKHTHLTHAFLQGALISEIRRHSAHITAPVIIMHLSFYAFIYACMLYRVLSFRRSGGIPHTVLPPKRARAVAPQKVRPTTTKRYACII